jgi:hypothetical protein
MSKGVVVLVSKISPVAKEYSASYLVEKVIIAQESVGRFANHIQPKSYTSMTKVCSG